MSRKKYPPLKPREVESVLKALGFVFKRQEGSHAQWERTAGNQRSIVTVDMACSEFDDFLMKSIVRQSGFNRDEFYGTTKKTAKAANLPAPKR